VSDEYVWATSPQFTPPTDLERQLYLSLRSQGCRCQYKRDKAGVPVWEGAPLARVRVSQCTRCRAVEEYEAAHNAPEDQQTGEADG
jgi:hypothetical protein